MQGTQMKRSNINIMLYSLDPTNVSSLKPVSTNSVLHCDFQHDGTQNNDAQRNNKNVVFMVKFLNRTFIHVILSQCDKHYCFK